MVAEWERGDTVPATTASTAAIRVLCVDDDPSFCDLAALQLERVTAAADRPVSVVTETDPSEVPSYLPDVDCVVSDYDMPDVDGLELLETVREFDADVQFILFTGRGSEEIASRATSAGVTDYVRKGGQSDRFVMLANRIEEAVARYEAERELERSNDRLRRSSTSSRSASSSRTLPVATSSSTNPARRRTGAPPRRSKGDTKRSCSTTTPRRGSTPRTAGSSSRANPSR